MADIRPINFTATASESDLNSDNFLWLDTPQKAKKLPGDAIAPKTYAHNIANSIAPEFDPNKVGGYVKYELVVFDGTNYMFKNPHSGAWNASDVVEIPCSLLFNRVLGSDGIETYSGTIEGGANYGLVNSLYKSGDVINVSVQSSQRVNFVGINLNNESVIIKEFAYDNVSSSFQYVLQQDFKSFGLYVYGSSSSEVALKIDTTLGVRIDAVNVAMQQCLTKNNIEPYSIAVATGSYIRASDGVAEYSANGRCSDYVRVQPGDKIKVKCYLTDTGAKVACYDTDKKYIAESSLITSGSYNNVFVIPSGVSYIRCSAYVSSSAAEPIFDNLPTAKLVDKLDAVNVAMQQCLTKNNIEPYSIAVTTGSYIRASDGVAEYSANGRCSDYVRVQPGDKIKVKCYLTDTGAKVACYDTDKKYIAESSLITSGSYNNVFVIPSGVSYIRCSAYVSSGAAEPIFENLPTAKLVDNIGDYYLKTSDYIATQFTLVNGAYLDASTGELSSSSAGRYTDYVEVSEGDRFYIKCYLSTGGVKAACYNENKQYEQNKSLVTDGTYNGYFVIPSGIRYVRFSGYVSSGSSEPIFESVPKKSFNPKNDNLKLLVFGDSISEDFYYTISQEGYTTAVTPSTRKAWSYRSNLVLNFSELRNYAKSGASYKNQSFGEWNRLSISEQVLIAINDKTDPGNVWGDDNFVPDIIVFAAGTNDGSPNDTPESALSKIVYDEDGSVDTSATLTALNRSKFCEAVMWSMLKIRIEYPYALGMCVLPIQRCSSDVNFGNLNTYLTTMARRYGFIPIDGISECGIIKDNNKKGAQGATLNDGLHPNIQGNRMMARMMIQAIDRYYYPTSKL